MNIDELTKQALVIKDKYALKNTTSGHKEWSAKEFMLGFVGDVGDLAKLIMAKENLRHIDNVDAKLSHELADNLWSILVLAEHYGVNLEVEFAKTMGELEKRISA